MPTPGSAPWLHTSRRASRPCAPEAVPERLAARRGKVDDDPGALAGLGRDLNGPVQGLDALPNTGEPEAALHSLFGYEAFARVLHDDAEPIPFVCEGETGLVHLRVLDDIEQQFPDDAVEKRLAGLVGGADRAVGVQDDREVVGLVHLRGQPPEGIRQRLVPDRRREAGRESPGNVDRVVHSFPHGRDLLAGLGREGFLFGEGLKLDPHGL